MNTYVHPPFHSPEPVLCHSTSNEAELSVKPEMKMGNIVYDTHTLANTQTDIQMLTSSLLSFLFPFFPLFFYSSSEVKHCFPLDLIVDISEGLC